MRLPSWALKALSGAVPGSAFRMKGVLDISSLRQSERVIGLDFGTG
jgi:hypothetical protein